MLDEYEDGKTSTNCHVVQMSRALMKRSNLLYNLRRYEVEEV